MKLAKLDKMTNGWFIGNFIPTLIKTNDVEVAVKRYKKGAIEQKHYHKIATEITVVAKGKVKMNGVIYVEGDIILIEPSEVADFEAIEDSINVVVKFPGASDDKYIVKDGLC
jgi:quercetin dioxygenase-like cupin family protein